MCTHSYRLHGYFLKPLPSSLAKGEDSRILSFVYECLFAKGVQSKVITMVMTLTENLLKEITDTEEGDTLHSCHGYTLVMPHVSILMKYISERVAKCIQGPSQQYNLKKELVVLSMYEKKLSFLPSI